MNIRPKPRAENAMLIAYVLLYVKHDKTATNEAGFNLFNDNYQSVRKSNKSKLVIQANSNSNDDGEAKNKLS